MGRPRPRARVIESRQPVAAQKTSNQSPSQCRSAPGRAVGRCGNHSFTPQPLGEQPSIASTSSPATTATLGGWRSARASMGGWSAVFSSASFRYCANTMKKAAAAPLWLGVHEAAHAVARLALDETLPYPGPALRFVNVRRDGDVLGQSAAQLRNSSLIFQRDKMPPSLLTFLPNMIRNSEYDVIEDLAGPAAECRATRQTDPLTTRRTDPLQRLKEV
jgi:hypothetical protein